jgi:antitoxin ParD1/3/4
METMNIALPAALKQFVQSRVGSGGYSSVSEYVRELIRADQKRHAEERIGALLLDESKRALPQPLSQEYLDAERRQLIELIRSSKKKAD